MDGKQELFDKLWNRVYDVRLALTRRGIGNNEGRADLAVWEMLDRLDNIFFAFVHANDEAASIKALKELEKRVETLESLMPATGRGVDCNWCPFTGEPCENEGCALYDDDPDDPGCVFQSIAISLERIANKLDPAGDTREPDIPF